jgi:peptidoglycan-associated lipoprotein
MIIILFVGIGFITVGCAKKNIMEKNEEVKPPVQKQAVQTPPPSFESQKAEPTYSMQKIKDEIKAFEDNDIHFDFDKFDLTSKDMETLSQKVSFLKENPDLKIRIEGNCDERGTTEYNLALGDRRAKSAQSYLTEQGIAPERISTISYGKEKPLDPSHNEKAWAKNRRDHFAVINK